MNKLRKQNIIFIFLYLCSPGIFSQNKSVDTLPALVQYGNSFLLEESFYQSELPVLFLDSLILTNPGYETDLTFLKRYVYKNSFEKIIAIDSLLDAPVRRYDLINELERMVFYFRDKIFQTKSLFADLTGESEYPSHLIYNAWNTRNFKNQVSTENDSSVVLLLTNPMKKQYYKHPVCITTINKYGGKVTSRQGWRDGKRHNGVDINLDQWDSVLCAFDGKVRFAKEYEGYGKVVIVRHFNGLETIYAHLARIKVKAGQNIEAGELLGLAGSTGNSEGSHLHFELRYKDQVLNPENIIDFNTFELKSDTLTIRKTGDSFVAIPSGQSYHIIERGDYPMKIASRYGMDPAVFNEINNIGSKTKLIVGQRVSIK